MRAWQLNPGYLVDRGPARTAVITSLVEELPEGPWRELHDFVQVDAQGKVVRGHQVGVYSIEEELTVTAFAVLQGELRELTVRTFHGPRYRVEREERVVLSGLQELTDSRLLDFLASALSVHQKARDEGVRALQQKRTAGIEKIPGSTGDPGLGKDYMEAQKVVRNRILSYGLTRDTELLGVLGKIGILAQAVGRPLPPPLEKAVHHLAEGCRLAAFDCGVEPTSDRPAKGEWPKLSDPARTELGELIVLLEVLERKLRVDAEIQEDVDALQNAAAFRKGADCLGRARELLRSAPAGP